MNTMEGLHVVLGGSGGVGSAVARLLAQETVAVRAVNRSGHIPFLPRRVQIMRAEAVVADTLRPACAGAAVIYHCIHPSRDFGLLVPITRNIVDVASEIGALLVVAGNMWPYGRVDGPLTEDLPFRSTGSTGRIYLQSAEIIANAVADGQVRAIVGRVAHCYGPHVRHVWPGTDFSAALGAKPSTVVGDLDAPHTYTFVDDFARGLIQLAGHEGATGKVWHVASPPPITMREFLQLVYDDLRVDARFRVHNPLLVWLRSLVNPEAHRLQEMRYQFDRPFVVDARQYESVFGARVTPHSEGIRRTLDWIIKLEEERRRAATPKP